jgi:GAF domain-containing protein
LSAALPQATRSSAASRAFWDAIAGKAPAGHRRDGPCISAAQHQSIVRIEDTRQDERWPQFSTEAARLHVRSMLCVPLWVDDRGLGALSL